MTTILNVIFGNLASEPETLRFPARVEPQGPRFRGPVTQKVERCVSCAICDIVCASGAIELHAMGATAEWSFDPGRCTFCGRCVKHCPVGALRQEKDGLGPYAEQLSVVTKNVTKFPVCAECGTTLSPFEGLSPNEIVEVAKASSRNGQLCTTCSHSRAEAAVEEAVAEVASAELRAEGLTDER